MDRVYLDCSGLHNIRLEKRDIPDSIYIDGSQFLQGFSQCLHDLENIINQVQISTPPQKSPFDLKVERARNFMIDCLWAKDGSLTKGEVMGVIIRVYGEDVWEKAKKL